ncbi:MAG: hypothetical protein FGM24_09435 [Candidatus Kapabacteria bacterium]|nr:hypothetical protein [Candidatus Kapabacteria bacterium]
MQYFVTCTCLHQRCMHLFHALCAPVMMRSIVLLAGILFLTVDGLAQLWLPVIPNRAVYSLAVNPMNPRTLLAGNMARTVFRSTDGGATWEELAIRNTDGSSKVSCIYIHPVDTNLVFAGGNEFDGLERSTDGGVTWKSILRDPQGFRMEFIGESVVAHPTAPDTMYAIRNSPGTLYRSTDRGVSWDSLSSPGPAAGGDRYMRSITVAPDSTNIILVGGYTTFVHRSTDGGRTFTKDPVATRTGTVGAFRWSTITPGTVYASVQFNVSRASATPGGIWRSTDWGATWEVLAHNAVSLIALEVYPNDIKGGADVIFVGGNSDFKAPQSYAGDSLAYKSNDGGITWQNLSDVPWTENEYGETTGNITAIKRSKQGDVDVVLLASESGMFMSTIAASVAPSQPSSPEALRVGRVDDNMITVAAGELNGPISLEMYAVDGRRLMQQDALAANGRALISIPSLHPGVYVVAVHNGIKTWSTRFVQY